METACYFYFIIKLWLHNQEYCCLFQYLIVVIECDIIYEVFYVFPLSCLRKFTSILSMLGIVLKIMGFCRVFFFCISRNDHLQLFFLVLLMCYIALIYKLNHHCILGIHFNMLLDLVCSCFVQYFSSIFIRVIGLQVSFSCGIVLVLVSEY